MLLSIAIDCLLLTGLKCSSNRLCLLFNGLKCSSNFICFSLDWNALAINCVCFSLDSNALAIDCVCFSQDSNALAIVLSWSRERSCPFSSDFHFNWCDTQFSMTRSRICSLAWSPNLQNSTRCLKRVDQLSCLVSESYFWTSVIHTVHCLFLRYTAFPTQSKRSIYRNLCIHI